MVSQGTLIVIHISYLDDLQGFWSSKQWVNYVVHVDLLRKDMWYGLIKFFFNSSINFNSKKERRYLLYMLWLYISSSQREQWNWWNTVTTKEGVVVSFVRLRRCRREWKNASMMKKNINSMLWNWPSTRTTWIKNLNNKPRTRHDVYMILCQTIGGSIRLENGEESLCHT
jgi:hypothetical protein